MRMLVDTVMSLQLANHPLDRKTHIIRNGDNYTLSRVISQGEVSALTEINKFVLPQINHVTICGDVNISR